MSDRTKKSDSQERDIAPPKNLDAERSLLGAVFAESDAELQRKSLGTAAQIVNHDDFFLPQHKIIFRLMCTLASEKIPIDLVIITEKLETNGELGAAGGAPYIASLCDDGWRRAHIEHYALIVREKAVRRRAVTATIQVQKALLEGRDGEDEDIESLLSWCRSQITRACDPGAMGKFHGIGFNGHLSYPYSAFEQTDFPKRDFLIEGLLPRNGTAMVFSMPHHLKSYFTTAVALAATTSGTRKLGMLNVPKPVRTLLYQAEDWPGELQWRMSLLAPYLGVNKENLFVLPRVDHNGNPIDIHLPDAKSKAALLREIEHHGIELVMLDVARRIARVDLNSPKESARFLEEVDELRHASTQPAVMLVHHENRKEADIMYASAGSYNLPGWANVMIQFKRKSEVGAGDQKISRVEIEVDSKLSASLDPMRMVLDLHSENPIRLEPLEQGEAIAELREGLGSVWTLNDLREVLMVPRTNAQRRLRKLQAAGLIEKVTESKSGRGGGLARYRFVGSEK